MWEDKEEESVSGQDKNRTATPSLSNLSVDELKRHRSTERARHTGLLKDAQSAYDAGEQGNQDVLAYSIQLLENQSNVLLQIDQVLADRGEEADATSGRYRADSDRVLFMSKRLLTRMEQGNSRPSVTTVKGDVGLPSLTGLPQLSLPTFNGNPLEWRPWFDVFSSTVHDLNISNVRKFAYLRSSLTSNALSAIAGIPATAANYERALGELKRRFADPSLLISLYSAKVVSLPCIRSDDTRGYREVIDQFQSCLCEIRGLADEFNTAQAGSASINVQGVKSDLSALILGPLLESKLPPEVQLEWGRKTPDPFEKFDVDKLLDFAKRELENRERLDSQYSKGKMRTDVPLCSPLHVKPVAKGFSSAFVAYDVCFLCNTSHPLYRCSKFKAKTPRDRYTLAREHQLCFNCLTAHPGLRRDCPSERSCKQCGQRHHTLLHLDDREKCKSQNRAATLPLPSLQERPGVRASQAPGSSSSSTEGVNPSPSLSVVTAVAPSPGTALPAVFMKIARVFVSAPGSDKGVYVFALLDDGSKRSYIKEDLAKVLNIQPSARCIFSTGSFGENIRTLDSSRICVEVQGVNGHCKPVRIQAWTTDKLCPPVTQEKINRLPPVFDRLSPWADFYDGSDRTVSLLIGADHVWDCTLEEIVRVPGQPTAVSTVFGWILSGSSCTLSSVESNKASSTVNFIQDFDVQQFWALESIGIQDEVTAPSSTIVPEFVPELGRYQVRLPFKDHRRPECNLESARVRLSRMTSRLTTDQLVQYSAGVSMLQEKGVVEPALSPLTSGFFLPHHGVWKRKLRLVFDASARDPSGNSLNSFLDAGPNLLASLVHLLLRFRMRPFPVVADVESAFHTILVHPEDRNFLKFLWNSDVLRFARVPFGISSGPFLMHAVIRYHIEHFIDFGEEFSQTLRDSFYCDNLLNSFDSAEQSQEFLNRSIACLKTAGMNLKPEDTPSRILGVHFCSSSDLISVDTSVVAIPPRFSRRELLRSISAVFDPLGLASAWTIKARLMLQEAWKSGADWDEELEEHIRSAWLRWIHEAGPLFSVQRCVHLHSTSVLHVFCDSSSSAYAFIAYLVHPEDGAVLLFSKARVAPVRPTASIPRLELLAALLGSRFAHHFRHLAPIRSVLWTDSQTVLSWIRKGPARRDVFVSNRLREILDKTNADQWRFVPTYLNPADIPSRGLPLQELQANDLYLKGPVFLTEDETKWPALPKLSQSLIVIEEPVLASFEPVIVSEAHSSYRRLLRVTSWVRRFCLNLLAHRKNGTPIKSSVLQVEELNASDDFLLRMEQRKYYPSEVQLLEQKGSVPSSSPLFPLRPRLSPTGCMEAVPRTGSLPVPILSSKSWLASLFITHVHQAMRHVGAEATLAEVRRKVWIPRGRSLVKRLVFSCVPCRRFKAPSFVSEESHLLSFRTTPAIPFHRTGVDYFGPIYLADGKVWVLLFTCATVRAVHLELVTDGSAAACHLALRRFLARRIRPFETVQMFSDNARSFLRMSTMSFPCHSLIWKTIPERSPWWGGFWERMVRTVKLCLKVSLRHLLVKKEELEAVLYETEALVNSRPLTHVPDQLDDPSPLCPIDFLFGSSSDFENLIDVVAIPERSLRHLAFLRQRTVQNYWKRWTTEYLTTLQTWRRQSRPTLKPFVNQVVLVKENSPRGVWALAKILELIPGQDGISRAAWILHRGRRTRRAIDLLVPLELDEAATVEELVPALPPTVSTSAYRGGTDQKKTIQGKESSDISVRRTRTGREVKLPARFPD